MLILYPCFVILFSQSKRLQNKYDTLMMKEEKNTYLSVENAEEFIVKDANKFPNRLICFIKLKMINQSGAVSVNSKGTGILLAPNLLLTAAHNYPYKAPQSMATSVTYVKQALTNGKTQRMYKVTKWHISSRYNPNSDRSSNFCDYALCELEPEGGEDEKEFIPVLALDEKEVKEISQIEITGFPVKINQKMNKDFDASSFYIRDMMSDKGQIINHADSVFTYKIRTDMGVSGAPIIAVWRGHLAIIGIHKCKNNKQNLGVSATQMLEEVNAWGQKLIGRPLILTPRTLGLHQDIPASNMPMLKLLNKKLRSDDILVLKGFKIDHFQQISLTGNCIGDTGLELLLSKPFPQLKMLMLTDNKLTKVPGNQLLNISKVQTLSLSVNNLTDLPKQLNLLTNLTKLWLSYNPLAIIPVVLLDLAKPGVIFHLSGDKIDVQKEPNLTIIHKFQELKVIIKWKHHSKENHAQIPIKQINKPFQKKPIT